MNRRDQGRSPSCCRPTLDDHSDPCIGPSDGSCIGARSSGGMERGQVAHRPEPRDAASAQDLSLARRGRSNRIHAVYASRLRRINKATMYTQTTRRALIHVNGSDDFREAWNRTLALPADAGSGWPIAAATESETSGGTRPFGVTVGEFEESLSGRAAGVRLKADRQRAT